MVGKRNRCGSVLTPEVIDKDCRLESAEKDDCNQKDKNRDQLGDRGQNIEGGSFLYTFEDQPVEKPDENRGTNDGDDVVSAAEHREEMSQCTKKQGSIGYVAKEGADPVAPGRVESDKFAEAFFSIAVDAVGKVGSDAVKSEKTHHQAEHADTADRPADEDTSCMCAGSGHIAGCRENPAADGGADDHGGQFGKGQGIVVYGIVNRRTVSRRVVFI